MVKCAEQAVADARNRYTIDNNVDGIIECYNKIL